MTLKNMRFVKKVGDYIFAVVDDISFFKRVEGIQVYKPQYSCFWRDLKTGKFMPKRECEQLYEARTAREVLNSATVAAVKGAAHD